MKVLKKCLILLLILSTVNLFISKAIFAEPTSTKHPLEIRSTPQEEIPKETVKKTSGWALVVVLGLIGGAAAALSNGGGDSEGSGSGTGGNGSETGDVDYTW